MILAELWTSTFQDSHVTLVCVDSVKQGLRCHPLDRQAALEGTGGGIGASPTGGPAPSSVRPPSHCWFSCSSQYDARHGPAQSQRSSSRCPLSPAHFGQPGPGGCTGDRAGDRRMRTHSTSQEPGGSGPSPVSQMRKSGFREGPPEQSNFQARQSLLCCLFPCPASWLGSI